jgi:Zn-dependent protease with chaperone function
VSQANRAFYSLIGLACFVAASLGVASARLLLPLAADVGLSSRALTRWCLLLLTGSPETDELLLLGLLGLLPVALCLGLGSLVRQWWATRHLLRVQAAARLPSPPRRITRVSRRLGLAQRVDVIQAAQPYSFCYGLLRPRICLSTGLVDLLSETELEAVLLHERYHLRSRDPLKVLLARALGRAFFFLPLVAELGRHYLIAKELAADREVICAQGQGHQLASVLYKLITASSEADAGAAVAGLISTTAARIDHLLDPQVPARLRFSPSALAISTLVLFAVAVVMLAPGLVGVGAHVHGLLDGTAIVCRL